METKTFEARVLLTVTTGRLLTKGQGPRDNGIGDMYELLGWMTNDSPFTHQLGRFAEECKPWLLRWFPELASASGCIEALDGLLRAMEPNEAIEQWLKKLDMPASYDVPRIPNDDHEKKNPYDELVAMRGTDEGIVIASPSSDT